jgi:hypothetical protein
VAAEDSEDRCRDYATKAISQNDENLRKRCGYTGEAWQANRRAHFDYCLSVSSRQARREQEARNTSLSECEAQGGGGDLDETDCRDYAEKATASAKEAERLGCGYSGDRWTRIYTRHYNWCRLARRGDRAAEAKARDKDLAQCRDDQPGGGDDTDRCQPYAEEALQHQAENKKLNCGLSGLPRWSRRLKRHLDFCKDASRDELQSESQARRQALRQCREEAKSGDSDRSEACRDYADSAAGQQAENRKYGCGFQGENWRSSTAVHYEWCMQNTRADREELHASRGRDLKRCREEADGGGGGSDCGGYADEALAAAKENQRQGCGFGGGRWSGNSGGHEEFCRTASPKARAREQKIRVELLGICKANPGRASKCREYSNLAVEHQKANIANGCGFTGPRWNSNYEEHFAFCMGVNKSSRRIENFSRVAALLTCR